MILDSLKNAERYYSLLPRLEKAFDYIRTTDLNSLEPGRHEIDGKELFVNISECDLKKPEDAKLEVHNAYVDIQVLVAGEQEGFGYMDRNDLEEPKTEFDTTKDVQFFNDLPQTIYVMWPGQFSILFPEDAHAPQIGSGRIKKAIFKVLI
ncbi:MAG: YhcH/YjgK/YiaL family protein [Rikenellaceae bacterium]